MNKIRKKELSIAMYHVTSQALWWTITFDDKSVEAVQKSLETNKLNYLTITSDIQ